MFLFQFPLGRPKCGWEGEYCRSETRFGANATASVVTILVALSIIAFSTLAGFQRYRYICVRKLRHVGNHYFCRLSICPHTVSPAPAFISVLKPRDKAKPSTWSMGSRDPQENWCSLPNFCKIYLQFITFSSHPPVLLPIWNLGYNQGAST